MMKENDECSVFNMRRKKTSGCLIIHRMKSLSSCVSNVPSIFCELQPCEQRQTKLGGSQIREEQRSVDTQQPTSYISK